MASRTASETWSAILSGWPSVTDSEVKVQRLTSAPVGCAVACSVGPDPVYDQPRVDHGVEDGAGHVPLVGQWDILHHAVGDR